MAEEKITPPGVGRKTRLLILAGPPCGGAAGAAAIFTGLTADADWLTNMLLTVMAAGLVLPAVTATAHIVRRTVRVIATRKDEETGDIFPLTLAGYLIFFAVIIPGILGAAILGGAEERPAIGMGGAAVISAICLGGAWLTLRMGRRKPTEEEN